MAFYGRDEIVKMSKRLRPGQFFNHQEVGQILVGDGNSSNNPPKTHHFLVKVVRNQLV